MNQFIPNQKIKDKWCLRAQRIKKQKLLVDLTPFFCFSFSSYRIGTEIPFSYGHQPWSSMSLASNDSCPSNRTTRSCEGNSTKFLTYSGSRNTNLPALSRVNDAFDIFQRVEMRSIVRRYFFFQCTRGTTRWTTAVCIERWTTIGTM